MIIYKIQNNINGKIYIGKTKWKMETRIKRHMHDNKYPVQLALNKYGLQAFTITVIDHAVNDSDLTEKERYWIAALACKYPMGYNLTDGGDGNANPLESTRARMSSAHKGMSPWNKGVPHTLEARAKMSAARKGRPSGRKGTHHSEETKAKLRLIRGERHRGFGKPISEAQKKKLSIAHMGKRLSEEHKRKLSEAKKGKSGPWLGRRRSEETKQKLREHAIRQKMHRNTITGRFEPTVKSNVQR